VTPRAQESLARLGSGMPLESAQEVLEDLVGIQVSKARARRTTLQTGAAALAVEEAEMEHLKRDLPHAPQGVPKQAMSADGAFVHLVGGEWVARVDAGDWGGQAYPAGRSLHPAHFRVFPAGGGRRLDGGGGGRNASPRTRTGGRAVRGASWGAVGARSRRRPSSGCGAHSRFCACGQCRQ
jgi:hypothetical protein